QTVELDAHTYQNVTFHRLQGTKSSDEDKRIYGGPPSLTVGVGNSTVWLGIGGDGVQPALERAIDLVSVPTSQQGTSSTAPFQVVFRVLPWLSLPEREEEDPTGRILAEEAMEKNQDAVRIEIRPNETGGRVRMQFDQGFIRLLGLFLAHAYDSSQI
ncbi:MAG: hypothetical protein KDA80_21380, partial [Planctomycetaceae bacterium]|nr:hypothetical protein [Planctomycetaceae bacterium]